MDITMAGAVIVTVKWCQAHLSCKELSNNHVPKARAWNQKHATSRTRILLTNLCCTCGKGGRKSPHNITKGASWPIFVTLHILRPILLASHDLLVPYVFEKNIGHLRRENNFSQR
eukprot:5162514-Amphidinium_carterae.1